MHAIYTFLMDLPIQRCAKEVKRAALSQFELQYLPLCDENNWYQEMALVTRTERVLQLCGDGDWRGRDSWYSTIRKIERGKRWDWAWKFAIDCCATDAELFNTPSIGILPDPNGGRKKIEEMSFDEVLQAMREWIPKTLARAYANVQPGGKNKDTFLDDCLRQKRSAIFEILNECKKPPFARPRSPYEYQAFTLCESEKGNAIMFVDIHT